MVTVGTTLLGGLFIALVGLQSFWIARAIDSMGRAIDRIETRMERLEGRMERLEARMTRLEVEHASGPMSKVDWTAFVLALLLLIKEIKK